MIALRPGDPRYPERLRALALPPDPLWVSGTLPEEGARTVAVVGTRRLTPYGTRMARAIAHGLARAGAVIVSGLAQGIDSIAHSAALEAGGRTVAVLGEGLTVFDETGPLLRRRLASRIRERGALVSEYALDVRATKWTFPKRNGTLAALSDAIVVVEAPVRSGALITADHAIELGRPLFAVPGPLGAATWEGSNGYIARGLARLLLGPADVAACLGLAVTVPPAARKDRTVGGRVLEMLAAGPADVDGIAAIVGARSDAFTLIAEMLLAGAIAPTGDGRFARTK